MAKAMTKSQLYRKLAENVDLPRKTVVAIAALALSEWLARRLRRRIGN